ncbi:MAG: hypothetical protein ABIT09_04945 [Croceibacterium sp.]
MPRFLKIAFWSAAAFAFVMAVLPHPPEITGRLSDKIQHTMAFATLAGLGAAAYRRLPPLRLLAGLSAFGALIEVVQAIPVLHRDSDALDWLVDTLAVAVVLGVARLWLRSREKTFG